MPKRRLTHEQEFKNHPIATDSQTACDTATLASIDTLLKSSLEKADCPRLLLFDIHFPIIRQDVNELFRDAQADFCKSQLRHGRTKTRYVGFKDTAAPNTIRVAAVYDDKTIRDNEILHDAERILNRKINDEFCPAIVEPLVDESMMLDQSNYNNCFYNASKIARVAVVPTSRHRVLFSSKG